MTNLAQQLRNLHALATTGRVANYRTLLIAASELDDLYAQLDSALAELSSLHAENDQLRAELAATNDA